MANLLNIRKDIEMLERAPVDRWRGEYVLDLLSGMADEIERLREEKITWVTKCNEANRQLLASTKTPNMK